MFQLDPAAGKEFMGYIVGANPLGQMLFSPLVGYWGNKMGSIRIPLLCSLALFTMSSAVYSSLEIFPSVNIKYWMLGARFFVGVSSGMLVRYVDNLCLHKNTHNKYLVRDLYNQTKSECKYNARVLVHIWNYYIYITQHDN